MDALPSQQCHDIELTIDELQENPSQVAAGN